MKDAVREQALPLALFAVAAVALLAAGPSRSVGVYRYLFGFHAGPLGILHWASLDAMTLAYAAGWIIVPGALLGLWLTLARPRTTEELAFGVIVAARRCALLRGRAPPGEPRRPDSEIQERYVFYAAPSARPLLRPLRLAAAGRCACRISRSPRGSCSSRSACR